MKPLQNVAIVFPGQGSQHVGMMQDLVTTYDVAKQTFEAASDILGYDMLSLALQGPEERLNQTEYTQPALLTASVAAWRVWQQQLDVVPTLMAGHSLGEYSALVCANSLAFADGLQLVAERGRLMQAAVPAGTGAMAAIIGLGLEDVTAACHEAAQGDVVAPANLNAIGQIVISGSTAAVNRAVDLCKSKGAKLAKTLPVSVPSHCDLMRPAALKLADTLAAIPFNTLQCRVIHNADVASHTDAPAIRHALVEQLYCPVRWIETMQYCANNGITTVIELGPGKVLAGLNKRIDNRLETLSVYDVATLHDAKRIGT